MHAVARSLALLVVIACTPAVAEAQAVPLGGVNSLAFQTGSPTAKAGGVDVAVTQKPTAGYTCTKLVIRVIDDATGMTLAVHSVDNPGENVSKSFTGLGSNKVQVAVSATFTAADTVDVKRISAVVPVPVPSNPGGDGNG
jgi:hypothetical protein